MSQGLTVEVEGFTIVAIPSTMLSVRVYDSPPDSIAFHRFRFSAIAKDGWVDGVTYSFLEGTWMCSPPKDVVFKSSYWEIWKRCQLFWSELKGYFCRFALKKRKDCTIGRLKSRYLFGLK